MQQPNFYQNPTPEPAPKASITQNPAIIWLLLLVFPPAGIFFLWKSNLFQKTGKTIVSVAFSLYFLLYIMVVFVAFSPSTYNTTVSNLRADNELLLEQVTQLETEKEDLSLLNIDLQSSYDNLKSELDLISDTTDIENEKLALEEKISALELENEELKAKISEIPTTTPAKEEPAAQAAPTPPVTTPAPAPPVAEQPAAAPAPRSAPQEEPAAPVAQGSVYWVENGEVWHSTSSCSTLRNSSNIQSGSVEDAKSWGKKRACKRC